MATSQEVKDTYKSTLQDLTCNSKPLISVLTMLAEENVAHAKDIAEAIEEHLAKVIISYNFFYSSVKLTIRAVICLSEHISKQVVKLFNKNYPIEHEIHYFYILSIYFSLLTNCYCCLWTTWRKAAHAKNKYLLINF